MRAPLLLLLCAACIERPFGESDARTKRSRVDRRALSDVLVAPPADAIGVGAIFGNSAELVAYRIQPSPIVPGQRVRVTLYWRCRAEMDFWHVFVHLDGAAGAAERIHAEHDPAQGRFPTDAWMPGDFIADTFAFVAPKTALLLYVGFYSQGENRLAVTSTGRGRDDGADRLLAGVLPVSR